MKLLNLNKIIRKYRLGIILTTLLFTCNLSKAQLTDGMTGLLHMVNAEVQKDANVMLGGNFLNKHNLPNDKWWAIIPLIIILV